VLDDDVHVGIAMPGAETFRASADAYDRHVGRNGAQLASALIAFAGVEPGMRALDVGCGPGALTAALAERLGTASVWARTRRSRSRKRAGGGCRGSTSFWRPRRRCRSQKARSRPPSRSLFVNFLPDAEAGVREMARVTRSGGVVASCVWDYAGKMTLLRTFWDAAREVDPTRAAAADEGVVMRWCADGELAELWRVVGLRDVRFRRSSFARPTPTSMTCGRRSRPGLPRLARSAGRSMTTAAPRSAAPTAAASGPAMAHSSCARAWAVTGRVPLLNPVTAPVQDPG